ncbi:MAG: glycosyltransferase family 4 protein [Candidatus Nomurabacteria bacterium]|nr:glycosyltransferase family 4 protein [Candidatus Nomurabacteria bacterium]USN88132.1 MAG: glycosyltransferase family 4 protein [Candidatus Nomurabacteria bacterium]
MKLKIATMMPIFTLAHYKELGNRCEHILFCDERFVPKLPSDFSNRVVALIPKTSIISDILTKVATQLSWPVSFTNLGEALDKENPDVLVVTDFFHGYFWQCVSYVRKHKGKKMILYSETKRWPRNFISSAIMRVIFFFLRREKEINTVFVFSEEGKDFFNEKLPGARVVVMPNPVDTDSFSPATNKIWLPDNKLRVIMNSRFVPFKRHSDLIEAVSVLVKKGRSVSVTLIGRDTVGMKKVRKMIELNNLENVINILPTVPVSKIPDLYYQHDVLVLPSYNEAIGIVVPEAMACGLPTITSDTVGSNVYVSDETTGFIFETGNVGALCDALDKCFDTTKLSVMGSVARHRVLQFSIERMVSLFIKEVEQVDKNNF